MSFVVDGGGWLEMPSSLAGWLAGWHVSIKVGDKLSFVVEGGRWLGVASSLAGWLACSKQGGRQVVICDGGLGGG